MSDNVLGTDKPLYEVTTPDGHRYELWADGHVVGFPPHSLVVNRALLYVYELESQRIKDTHSARYSLKEKWSSMMDGLNVFGRVILFPLVVWIIAIWATMDFLFSKRETKP